MTKKTIVYSADFGNGITTSAFVYDFVLIAVIIHKISDILENLYCDLEDGPFDKNKLLKNIEKAISEAPREVFNG